MRKFQECASDFLKMVKNSIKSIIPPTPLVRRRKEFFSLVKYISIFYRKKNSKKSKEKNGRMSQKITDQMRFLRILRLRGEVVMRIFETSP